MFNADITDLKLLITAVDDKIWALQKELDDADEDDEMIGYTEEEQVRYMTLAAKLEESYTQACATHPKLLPYAKLVRPGVPGRAAE